MDGPNGLPYNTHPSIENISKFSQITETFSFSPVNVNLVEQILLKLDIKKATGFDNISPKLLKSGATEIAPHLTYFVNLSIKMATFPDLLKHAEVSSILKKGDDLNKTNYRPVSILTTISKIFEKNMASQLQHYFDDIFHPYLSAFRKGYSTQSLLLRIVEDAKHHIDKGELVGLLMMDLSKAFDCLPHKLTIAKLKAYGLSGQACLLLASYLSNRKQRVKIGDVKSEWVSINKGVPQGSNLGPLIFNIFINDIFHWVQKCNLYNYADDNTLMHHSPYPDQLISTLEIEADSMVTWFRFNSMKANPDKFYFIVLKKIADARVTSDIELETSTIPEQTSVKLLGLTIDSHLTFNDHIADLCKKAGRQLNVLRRLSSKLDESIRMNIYRAFIVSNFNYCSVVWHFCGEANHKRLEKIQERALRYVYNDFSSAYADLLNKAELCTITLSRLKFIATEIFKCVSEIGPTFLFNLVESKSEVTHLRDPYKLTQKHWDSVKYGKNSFSQFAPKLWNDMPIHIKAAGDLKTFKKLIDTWVGPTCKCNACRCLD